MSDEEQAGTGELKGVDFGVIFDNDGVLVDTEAVSDEAFRRALAEQGVEFPADDDEARYCGLTDAAILADVAERLGARVDRKLFGERKWALYQELAGGSAGGITLFPGAGELLEALRRAGVPLALASSGARLKVKFNLDAAGLGEYFTAIITGDDVVRGKPDPEVFLTAAARLGVAPAQSVVFEDSINGVNAARAAGCVAVGVATTFPAEKLVTYADIVVTSLSDVSVDWIRSQVIAAAKADRATS